jgi:predicted aspartyl protease
MPVYEVRSSPDILKTAGAILPNIEISLPQVLVDELTKKGMPIPKPITGNALIDTGASASVLDLSIISSLKISPVGVATVLTTAGPVQQNSFPIRVVFPRLVIDVSAVLGADLRPFGIVILIGRDILSSFLMIYHGLTGMVTLAY